VGCQTFIGEKMEINFKDTDEETENPDAAKKVEEENELKEFVVQYVGDKLQPENGEVSVEMIVEVFAEDFPEFLMVVAEENWIRGYHQALHDVEEGERLVKEQSEKDDEEQSEKDDE
tara:strand:+ start:26 stop:376 length:351 start_codon:yes stop_codon:yes gene_type:complete